MKVDYKPEGSLKIKHIEVLLLSEQELREYEMQDDLNCVISDAELEAE